MGAASAILALTLAVVFAASGVGKLRALTAAAASLRALRLPVLAPRAVVAAVSLCEVGIAVGLLMPTPMLLVAAGSASGLSLAFLVIVYRAYRMGSTDDCGCFGASAPTRIGTPLLVRNTLLVVVAGVLLACAVAGAPGVAGVVDDVSAGEIGALLPIVAAMLVAALVAALAWATGESRAPSLGARDAGPATVGAPDAEGHEQRPAELIVWDPTSGVVIDLASRAYVRAQMVVMVKPGCYACTLALEHLDSRATVLAQVVDVTVVVRASAGASVSEVLAHEPHASVVDIGDRAAWAVAGEELVAPLAVLVGTDGVIVEPVARGPEEVIALVDAICRATEAAESPLQR